MTPDEPPLTPPAAPAPPAALTPGELATLERLERLSARHVGGLVPQNELRGRRSQLDCLVASRHARRFEGLGPDSRAKGVVHIYYAPAGPAAAETAGDVDTRQPARCRATS
jgi:hypothetical protein